MVGLGHVGNSGDTHDVEWLGLGDQLRGRKRVMSVLIPRIPCSGNYRRIRLVGGRR